MKKAVMLINDTTYAFNLRSAIIEKLISENFEVVVVGQLLKHQDKLKAMGASLIGVETGRHGTNPFSDLQLMNTYKKILKTERPDVVLSYNIKPNVYGGMVCQQLKIPYLPNVTGLGTPVENPGPLQKLTTRLYKVGVAGANCIFFQNSENQAFFENHHMMPKRAKVRLLPGSGVDLDAHPAFEYPKGDTIHFQYTSRILKEKGIDLYLAAAKAVHEKYPNTVFHICGGCDDERYIQILKEAQAAGYIVYHGQQKDMTSFLKQAACIVHPSYYPEGMSNVLLEGAASARPIIATDRAGCRETVEDGVTGFLIPIKDEQALIEALEKFMQMTPQQRKAMGLAGRAKMEREFDRKLVVQAYWEEIQAAMETEKWITKK